MANFIKPYNDDPFVGHLATPITSSAVTRAILQNLPAYRFWVNTFIAWIRNWFSTWLFFNWSILLN